MTVYLLEFLNDPESLSATKGTEELTHLSYFATFYSIAKPLIRFVKCLTITTLHISKNVLWRNWKIKTFFPCIKNSVSGSIRQYHTLFQIEMTLGIFSAIFWILANKACFTKSSSHHDLYTFSIHIDFTHPLQWEIFQLLISLVLIELIPVLWKVL